MPRCLGFTPVLFEQLRELLLQGRDLRPVAHHDVGVIWVVQRIILMIGLSIIKPLQRNQLGDNRLRKNLGSIQLRDVVLADDFCCSSLA